MLIQTLPLQVLWRINKAIVKEFLPAVPLDIYIDPWWIAHVVNMGETQLRWQSTVSNATAPMSVLV